MPRPLVRSAVVGLLLGFTACAPRAHPLGGNVVPARLPRTQLPPGHRRIVFKWEYEDPGMTGRGDGVARVAPPDSVRLDLFLAAGLGSGYAVVVGDSVYIPGIDIIRRYLPPPALLWAAMGRLHVPAGDTVARQDGGVLRVDIGREPTWRATFTDGRLTRLEHIAGGRVVEYTTRTDSSAVRYENHVSRRSLTLRIEREQADNAFDPAIWRH